MTTQIALRIRILPALFLATVFPPETVLAEGTQVRIQTDLEYTYSDVDREVKASGEETESGSSYFKQKYNLELQNQLFPYLKIRGGGHYQLIDSSTDTRSSIASNDSDSTFEGRTRRGFAELDFTNPIYGAGAGYRYQEDEESSFVTTSLLSGVTREKIFREEYSGLFRWRPVGLPSIDLDVNNFQTWTEDKTGDVVFDLLVLKGRYGYRDFSSDYSYTRNDRDDRLTQQGLLTQIHNAGIQYGTDVFRNRLEVNAAARLNYDAVEPSGTGDVLLPTSSPGAPFYVADDRPPSTVTVVDDDNLLTDINIGKDGPTHTVAVGLDFGTPTEVDTIHVKPDVKITAIGKDFVWEVLISDDQDIWTPLSESFSYNAFDNRFEITFPLTETQFIKVVTTPITTASTEIRIAAIQAFTTHAGVPGEKLQTTTQTYNLGLRWAASNKTSATFESSAKVRDQFYLSARKTTLTGGIGVEHEFTPMFYADARVLRTETIDSERLDTTRHTYTASITGDYLTTLQQRLIYSGAHDEEGGDTGYSNSIFLRTNADIYRDWSVNLDLGYAAKNPITGPDNTSTTFRLTTNIVPHQKVNFTIDYLGSWDTAEDTPSSFNQIAKFQLFWVPVRTVSLFAGVNLRDDQRNQEGLNTVQSYSINWAPFPDGTLDLNLSYDQRIDTRGTESKILTPEIKWQVTRTTLLTLTFNYGTLETETDTRDVMNFRMNFRLFY